MLPSVQPARCSRSNLGYGARRRDGEGSRSGCGTRQGPFGATIRGACAKTKERGSNLMPDFLLEIGCEEIPARMIDAARTELARRVAALLSRETLLKGEGPQPAAYATPRRLALLAPGIAGSQPDLTEQVTGPSFKVAFKDGKPTPAAEAFAKKAGVDVGKLEKVTTPKGEYLAATVTKKGRTAAEVLAEGLPKEIAAIYWA